MRVKNYIFIGIAVLLVVFGGFLLFRYSPQDRSATQEGSSETDKIFALELQDYSNNPVSLANMKGAPLVINSWAAWCPFCRKELIDFAAVQKEFGDAITIIAIDRAESRETAKKYSDELGVTDTLLFLLDPDDSFYQAIGGFSMPETIFINSNGDIVFHKRGPMDPEEMRTRIQEML